MESYKVPYRLPRLQLFKTYINQIDIINGARIMLKTLTLILTVTSISSASTAMEYLRNLSDESLLVWIGLFALAVVGITILFISSKETLKIKRKHKEVIEKKEEIDKNQTEFLSNISGDIHDLTKKTLKTRKIAIEKAKSGSIDSEIEQLVKSENKLLNTTESLIEYLKLKSQKVHISNQNFNINHVLNEVAGELTEKFAEQKTELIFDINHTVPKMLIGDSVHVGQILSNILKYMVHNTPKGEVSVEITAFNTFSTERELQFKIKDTSIGLDKESLQNLFIPKYHEESGEYAGLELFVTQELVALMNGNLSVESVLHQGNTFILTIPFLPIKYNDNRKYRLPQKDLTTKKVLIVDISYNAALAIKKMFTYFRHKVDVVSSEEFLNKRPNLALYDIILLNEYLLEIHVVNYIERIKEELPIKIVALRAIYETSKANSINGVVDLHASKPFTQERILDIMIDLYKFDNQKNISNVGKNDYAPIEHKPDKHKDSFVEASNINIDSFNDFSGANILIVEDNIINQKVLVHILGKSGMKINIANNGQEAIDMLEKNPHDIDLVLMDINMPVMDGYVATSTLRDDTRFEKLPIIALSALVLESEIKKMFLSGVDGYLQKPLKIGMLYSALEVFLKDKINKNSTKPTHGKSVYGINIKQGISYTNNNEALYKELLNEFISTYIHSDKQLISWYQSNNFDEISKFCLDMKGLSGTIGAYKIHDLVTRIYKAILFDQSQILGLIKEYEKDFPLLRVSIRGYIQG